MNTLLILSTDSRESINKATMFIRTARQRGLKTIIATPKNVPELENSGDKYLLTDSSNPEYLGSQVLDENIVAVISCSDGVTSQAMFTQAHLGLTGMPDFDIAYSKLKSYQVLAKAGFDTIPCHSVTCLSDIENSPLTGEVFVKPDWSSGVSSTTPWGYKRFQSAHQFASFIKDGGYQDLLSNSEPTIMMDYIPHDGMYCISAILRDGKASCFGHSFVKVTGEDCFYDYVHYSEEYGTGALEPMVQNLWDLGFMNSFMYIQCLKQGDRLLPIDLNSRLSTYLDTLATHFDAGFYSRVLDFILGEADEVRISLPAKHTLIGRVRSDPHKKISKIHWEDVDGVLPLNFSSLTQSKAFYDKAYSWATYACLAENESSLWGSRDMFLSGVEIEQ